MLSKSTKWELGFVHYIAKFTISRFVISRFECTCQLSSYSIIILLTHSTSLKWKDINSELRSSDIGTNINIIMCRRTLQKKSLMKYSSQMLHNFCYIFEYKYSYVGFLKTKTRSLIYMRCELRYKQQKQRVRII